MAFPEEWRTTTTQRETDNPIKQTNYEVSL